MSEDNKDRHKGEVGKDKKGYCTAYRMYCWYADENGKCECDYCKEWHLE